MRGRDFDRPYGSSSPARSRASGRPRLRSVGGNLAFLLCGLLGLGVCVGVQCYAQTLDWAAPNTLAPVDPTGVGSAPATRTCCFCARTT
jgi:hypothetical protein